MFDIGFSELVVIAIVALIVIGPERLPRVARTAGALLGRFQRYVNDIKSEVRREMEVEDLKNLHSQLTEQVQEVEQTIHKELRSAKEVARGALAEAQNRIQGTVAAQPVADAANPGAAAAPTAAAVVESGLDPHPPKHS